MPKPRRIAPPPQDVAHMALGDLPPMLANVAAPAAQRLLIAFGRLGELRAACRYAKCDVAHHWWWLRHDEAYAAAWRVAQEMAIQRLEDYAARRATVGGSDQLLMFLLRGQRPERYGQQAASVSVAVQATAQFTLAELEQRYRQISAAESPQEPR